MKKITLFLAVSLLVSAAFAATCLDVKTLKEGDTIRLQNGRQVVVEGIFFSGEIMVKAEGSGSQKLGQAELTGAQLLPRV